MKKTFYICTVISLLTLTGCASTPYYGVDPSSAALMNYSSQMLYPYGGAYAQPTRMQTTCIQQGPWLQCY